jgi:pimeloyl-ACP methyl ester carboxylesterase
MRKGLKCLLLMGAAVGGMAYANYRVAQAYRPAFSALDGQPDLYSWRDGLVYYQVQGEGEPLLLLHDLGIASSSYEMKPLVDRLSASYKVYTLDWLGYGLSTRPETEYTAGAYEQLLGDFLTDVVKGPAVLVAAGAAAAYAVRLANRHPEQVASLALVCPEWLQAPISPRKQALLTAARALLKAPVLGTFIFNLLTSRPALGWYLRNRIFFDASLAGEGVLEYAWVTAHQPGARWAPLSNWTGLLDLNVASDLIALRQPVLVAWGQQARQTPVERIQAFKAVLPGARYRAFDRCGQWPQFEAAKAFGALLANWLQGKDKGAAAIFPGEVQPED